MHARVITMQDEHLKKKKTLTYKPLGRAIKDANYQAGTKNSQISCSQPKRSGDLITTVPS